MADLLLHTKLYPPRPRPVSIVRPTLLDLLDAARDGKLTLVSAPVGSGKTTIVTEWLADQTAAWLSLDENDNDPLRFVSYLVAALRTIGLGKDLIVQDTQAVITMLLNEITAQPDTIILVLDDYHVITAPEVDDLVTFMLDHQPRNFHLVILTRTDPDLPLARLRARGQLTEIRSGDLRFSIEEVKAFFEDSMGLQLSPANIIALEGRTEGWAAGLQLAALALKDQALDNVDAFISSFSGSNRYVIDYLADEVLHQQSAPIQQFLLQTAILTRLSAPLCDAVTDVVEPSAVMLHHLEQSNLFLIPLDDRREWYRYHHLFTDLLRQRLEQTHPMAINELHRRASRWYAQHGYIDDALYHAVAAPDLAFAAQIVEQNYLDAMQLQDPHRVRHWLNRLPEDFINQHLGLLVARAWVEMYTIQFAALDATIVQFEALRQATQDLPSHIDRMRAELYILQARLAIWRNDFDGSLAYADASVALLDADDFFLLTNARQNLAHAYLMLGDLDAAAVVTADVLRDAEAHHEPSSQLVTLMSMIYITRQQAKLSTAESLSYRMHDIARESHNIAMQAIALAWLARSKYERNHISEAIQLAQDAVILGKKGGSERAILDASLVLFNIHYQDDSEHVTQANQIMDEVYHSIQQLIHRPDLQNYLLAQRVRMWLRQGQLDEARQWADQVNFDIESIPLEFIEVIYGTIVRVYLTQGDDLDKAANLLDTIQAHSEPRHRRFALLDVFLLRALVLAAQGNNERAIESLKDALTIAAPEDYKRTFIEEGQPMAELLEQARQRDIFPEFCAEVLADMQRSQGLIEPLSERELDVLRLIAAGMKNQAIADELTVSLNTVRFHTKNIYTKLGVNSRTQAVAKGQALQLL